MNLKDALELAGVDYEMTLNRFSNNAMLLERFVKKFPNDKTFEELDAMFDAREIEPASFEDEGSLHDATAAGRGYAVAGVPNFAKAPTGLFFVIRPSAVSATIIV